MKAPTTARLVVTSSEAQKAVARRIIAKARRGDRVWIRTPHGTSKGRVALIFPSHLVLDAGGRYGRPIVATVENIV